MDQRAARGESPQVDPVLAKLLDLGKAASSNGGVYERLREIRQALHGVVDPLVLEAARTEIENQLKAKGFVPARAIAMAGAVFKPETRGGGPAPSLDADDLDLPHITDLAWKALTAANDPPFLFCAGSSLVRLERQPAGPAVLRPLTEDRLRHQLARAVPWTKREKNGPRNALPPLHVVKDMLADPLPPLPPAPRMVGAPVFSAQGELLATPGYHHSAAVYYAPVSNCAVPPIPERPTEEDRARAKALLCDELLPDFPFVGEAERAHALAFMLLPFVRDLISGPTPLHLFEKPSPGTGATLLVQMLVLPATGQVPPVMTEGRDEDEWRKRITAKLLAGGSVVLIDNVRRRLDTAALSAVITSTSWEDRLLGSTQMLTLPVRCAWAATANNAQLSNELARRTVRSRLDAKVDRPWERATFKHPLPQWAEQHRGELIWAALVWVQAWLVRGRPDGRAKPLGSFESWSRVVGGVLSVAGVPGFLDNLEELYSLSDVEGAENRRLIAAWYTRHATADVGANELYSLATSEDVSLDLPSKTERGQRMQLGHRLASLRDRRYTLADNTGEFSVRVAPGGVRHSTGRWRLVLEPSDPVFGPVRVGAEKSPPSPPSHISQDKSGSSAGDFEGDFGTTKSPGGLCVDAGGLSPHPKSPSEVPDSASIDRPGGLGGLFPVPISDFENEGASAGPIKESCQGCGRAIGRDQAVVFDGLSLCAECRAQV